MMNDEIDQKGCGSKLSFCRLRGILRSRVLRGVYTPSRRIRVDDSPANARIYMSIGGSVSPQAIIHFVGRTRSIVRLLTRIHRKDGSENFGGFVYVWDGSPQRDFVMWVFMCTNNITPFSTLYLPLLVSSLCLFYGYHAKGYHAPSILQGLSRLHHSTATTPVYLHPGYHATAPSSISGLSHLSYHASPHTYHVNRVITPALVSSLQFIDHRLLRHLSPPPTPPPGRHTYQLTPQTTTSWFHSRVS